MTNVDRCWICMDKVDNPMLLPSINDDLTESIYKNTYIIKNVDKFRFVYHLCCPKCIDSYLEHYGRFFKLVRDREIGKG